MFTELTGQTMATEMQTNRPAATAAGAEHYDVIVVGGGQAGLAMGYYLRALKRPFLILDANDHVGAAWSQRWASLRLFTPARYSSLPGMDFPADDPLHLPHRDEVVSYLQAYAHRFKLPVRLNAPVTRVGRSGSEYLIDTPDRTYHAAHVVIATGAFQRPYRPPFADQIRPALRQLHSSDYDNPGQLLPGDVLVVGVGSSGAQIALELAETGRKVYASGRDVGTLPRRLLGQDVYWWLYRTGLIRAGRDSFIGRRVAAKIRHQGGARVGLPEQELIDAGVERLPRLTGVYNGQPVVDGGYMPDVTNIIWATGYRPDFGWIDNLALDDDGYPRHDRGVVPDEPGLYFLGLLFLQRLDSALINGVGDDARYLARTIKKRLGSVIRPIGKSRV